MELSYKNLDDLILLKIFTYLPNKTLLRSMRVCKKWHHLICETIKQRSPNPQTFFYHLDDKIRTIEDLKQKLNSQLESIWCKPALSVFFLNRPANLDSLSVLNEKDPSNEKQKAKRLKTANKKDTLLDILKDKLSVKLPKIFIVGDGIVASDRNNGIEIESDCQKPVFSSLFVPENDMYRLALKPVYFKTKLPEFNTEKDLDSFLGLKPNEEIKFLLLLVDGYSDSKLVPLLDYINMVRKIKMKKNVKKGFACSGGIVQRLEDCSGKRTKLVFVCLISNEGSGCKVSQIMIREATQQNFCQIWDEKINLMKKSGVYSSEEKCLAFQVSCCGRGKDYHHQENFESNMFLKEFPNVALVGFFGYGEIGVDYLPDYSTDSNKNFIDDIQNREFLFEDIVATGFTSIFTLISFKNK